jgi:hypothetical protein
MKIGVLLVAATLLLSISAQSIVNPLQQDRVVELTDDIKADIEKFSPAAIAKLNLPTGSANNLPMCRPGHPDYFKFLGITTATLSESSPTAEAETPCFKKTTYKLVWKDARTAKISFSNQGRKSLFCSDHYLATTLISFDIHTNWMYITNSVTYKFKTDEEAQLAKSQGISIILMCDSWLHLIPNIIKTITLFVPDIAASANLPIPAFLKAVIAKRAYNFVAKYTGIEFNPRTEKVAISEEYIRQYVKSGDILVIRGPSGLGVTIMYATGGPIQHSAIAMWDDQEENKLWILEANGQGLVRMELEDWYSRYNGDIAWLHLSDDSRKQFNPSKAWEWFRSVENLEYGIRNFAFTLMDDPLHNFDAITDLNSVIVMLNILNVVTKGFRDTLITEALNMRLGTQGLSFADTLYEMDRRGTNIVETMKLPEKDGWIYSNGQNYVCSALSIKMLQEGGVLAGYRIHSHEFTPRDVFMLQIYEKDASKMPPLCQQNDPGLPFCQLKGKFKIDPTLYNSVGPYDFMNDNCPSMPPAWYRPPNC